MGALCICDYVYTYVKVSFVYVCRPLYFHCTVYLYVHKYIVHILCCAKGCTSHSQHRFEAEDLREQSIYTYNIYIDIPSQSHLTE